MEASQKDVMSEEYKDEKKKWDRTSDDPEAYGMDDRWGIVRDGDRWRLFVIFSISHMKEIASCKVDGVEPPFLWARSQLSPLEERLKSANWDERTLRGRPGEEGFHGGVPIPMQTFDAKAEARKKKQSQKN